jgi:uncharacterized protein (DUF305 family)
MASNSDTNFAKRMIDSHQMSMDDAKQHAMDGDDQDLKDQAQSIADHHGQIIKNMHKFLSKGAPPRGKTLAERNI